MATVYHVDGRVEIVQPKGERWTLQELQAAVEGYIEGVPNSNGRAYCNEEGLLRGLPFNRNASHRFGGPLVGPVIELDRAEAAAAEAD